MVQFTDHRLNPAQNEVQEHGLLESGFSCVLQLPTGAGKTWLAHRAIAASVASGRRAIYLSPLRALAEELAKRWTESFGEGVVGIFTGDYGGSERKFPVAYTDAKVLIMTPERLDACIRSWRSHWDWMPEVDWLVIDELHLLGDAGRGARLEGTVSRFRRLNPFCRVLGLSATLGNRGELADWLEGVEFSSNWRPVPLEWRISRYRKADEKPALLTQEANTVVSSGGQSLVFVQSRRRAETLAKHLSEQGLQASHHHAGLLHGERRKIEDNFRSGRSGILVATATLEMGLNLPARQVVLYDLQSFTGSEFEALKTNTVWQRGGRAGRPGLDEHGEVVLLAPTWDREAQRYLKGRFERIESGLSDPAAFAEQILVEVQAGFARNKLQLARAFSTSLAFRQGRLGEVGKATDEMVEAGMLRYERVDGELFDSETLAATPLGRVATRHLLRPATVLSLQHFLKSHPTFTYFDAVFACAATTDCEPTLAVDFEELDDLAALLAHQPSFVLADGTSKVSEEFGIQGKRLLSAMKAAAAMLRWTEAGEEASVAEDLGCYPFEISRLRESMDRLLLALGGICRTLDIAGEHPGEKTKSKSTRLRRIELLRQMLVCGLGPEPASLTFVEGIGPKWAQKLVADGIDTLEKLVGTSPFKLETLGGISAARATKWVEAARLLVKAGDNQMESTAPANLVAKQARPCPVDPYRLRRALELKVTSVGNEGWHVTGGLEPHRVHRASAGLVCDCLDHAKGHECKHQFAVRLHLGDETLTVVAESMQSPSEGFLDLMPLWFGNNRLHP